MNEFLVQFSIESRELVGQATDGLLRLEQSPADADQLDAVFRAFHTLKGGAGIVDFFAMEGVVHAAEDILSEARSGKRSIRADVVGECLGCLDQVVRWLEVLETTGTLPADAQPQADVLVQRLKALPADIDQTPSMKPGLEEIWIQRLVMRDPGMQDIAATAVRYAPTADCFFHGEDPFARISSLSRLLVLDLDSVAAWPSLSELDPYACNLVFTALAQCSASDARAHMQGFVGDCQIVTIAAARGNATHGVTPRVRAVLNAQLSLLGERNSATQAGRVASAGRTAANTMRYCGRHDLAQVLEETTHLALREGTSEGLQSAIARLLASPAPQAAAAAQAEPAARTLRVDAGRIDQLVRLTGEFTIAKNALGHTLARAQTESNGLADPLKDRFATFERLIDELQRAVLTMRVLPLRSVLQRFPRVIRELSSGLGKPVELKIDGDHTEADKAIVEMLFEPLLHVIRNAIDHGIEAPNLRVERGKPVIANIEIRATRVGDRVHIEVDDDGAGIDVERVRRAAKNRDIANHDAIDALTDAQALELLFAPGFSTAAKVTEMSGRGVGLDAVRAAVERVGGRVTIENRAPNGTTVKFSLPFSIMLAHIMMIEAGGQMFGVPVDALVETVSVATSRLAPIGATRALVHRDRTIPVLDLGRELGVAGARGIVASPEATIVIADVAGQWIGMHVERLGDRMEVVLKPLEGLLAGTPGIAGTTLTGDGRVLVVLDLAELLR